MSVFLCLGGVGLLFRAVPKPTFYGRSKPDNFQQYTRKCVSFLLSDRPAV